MPKVKISEYSATANSNTDVASINIDEGCAPSGINNAIRAVMGHLKDFQSGTSNDPFTVGSSGSLTLSYGTINGVAYLNGSRVVTTGSALSFDGTNLGVGLASPGCKVDVLAASNTSLSPTVRVYSNNLAVNTAISYDGIQGSGDFYIGSTSNSPVIFKQSNTEQMRLTATSLYTASTINVGIGTSSPVSRLTVEPQSGSANTLTIRKTGVTSFGSLGAYSDANGPAYFTGANVSFDSGGSASRPDTSYAAWNMSMDCRSTNTAIVFEYYNTAGTYFERMRINSSGNLLVGTTSNSGSTDKLHVDGNIGITKSNGNAPQINFDSSNANIEFVNRNSGGAKTFSWYYAVSGGGTPATLSTSGVWTNSSDARGKENISDIHYGLDTVMSLQPRQYDVKSDGSHAIGFVAQEVLPVVPELVHVTRRTENDEFYGLDYGSMTAVLVKAIQEQQALITQLTARITALEGA